jgi:hypothetical protein
MYLAEYLNQYSKSITIDKNISFISPHDTLYFELISEDIDIDIFSNETLLFSYQNNKKATTNGILLDIKNKNINIIINSGSCKINGIFSNTISNYIPPFEKCKIKLEKINSKKIITFIYDSEMLEYIEVFFKSIKNKTNDYNLVMFCKENDYISEHIKNEVKIVYFDSNLQSYKKWHKTIIYCLGSITKAEEILFFDVDMYIQSSLDSLMSRVNILNEEKILICKEQGSHGNKTLKNIIYDQQMPYFKSEYTEQIINLLDNDSILINGGVMAAKRKAFLRLESKLRSFENLGISYLDENKDADWREQALLNIALCMNNSIIELDKSFNKQLFNEKVVYGSFKELQEHNSLEKILHFNGNIGRKIFHKIKHSIGKEK